MKCILDYFRSIGESYRILNALNMNQLRITKKGKIKQPKKK